MEGKGRRETDVGSEPRAREVERVDEEQRHRARSAASAQVPQEEAPELLVLVDAADEEGLELVLEGEVERLCGEISNDVREVAAPEGEEALLPRDADEAVYDALVLLVGGHLRRRVLHLNEHTTHRDTLHMDFTIYATDSGGIF